MSNPVRRAVDDLWSWLLPFLIALSGIVASSAALPARVRHQTP